jgi:hypothetical protein
VVRLAFVSFLVSSPQTTITITFYTSFNLANEMFHAFCIVFIISVAVLGWRYSHSRPAPCPPSLPLSDKVGMLEIANATLADIVPLL